VTRALPLQSTIFLSEHVHADLFTTLAGMLLRLAELGLSHNDLKPEHVALVRGYPLLLDWDASTVRVPTDSKDGPPPCTVVRGDFIGTRQFASIAAEFGMDCAFSDLFSLFYLFLNKKKELDWFSPKESKDSLDTARIAHLKITHLAGLLSGERGAKLRSIFVDAKSMVPTHQELSQWMKAHLFEPDDQSRRDSDRFVRSLPIRALNLALEPKKKESTVVQPVNPKPSRDSPIEAGMRQRMCSLLSMKTIPRSQGPVTQKNQLLYGITGGEYQADIDNLVSPNPLKLVDLLNVPALKSHALLFQPLDSQGLVLATPAEVFFPPQAPDSCSFTGEMTSAPGSHKPLVIGRKTYQLNRNFALMFASLDLPNVYSFLCSPVGGVLSYASVDMSVTLLQRAIQCTARQRGWFLNLPFLSLIALRGSLVLHVLSDPDLLSLSEKGSDVPSAKTLHGLEKFLQQADDAFASGLREGMLQEELLKQQRSQLETKEEQEKALSQKNEELSQKNEELSQTKEELSQTKEELRSKDMELEELRRRLRAAELKSSGNNSKSYVIILWQGFG